MQVNLDPGSFNTAAGARDAAQEVKRGAEIVAPLRAGAAQSSVLSCCWSSRAAALVAVGESVELCGVRVLICGRGRRRRVGTKGEFCRSTVCCEHYTALLY